MNTNPLPLNNRRIILLRSPEKSQKIADMVRKWGGTPLFHPMLDLIPTPFLEKVTRELINAHDTIIFASANAVDFFLNQLKQDNDNPQGLLANHRIIPVGQETANHLLSLHIKPSLVPEEYSQEGILAALPTDLEGWRILLPNNLDSRKHLEDVLRERKAKVTSLPVYQSVPVSHASPLTLNDHDFIVFSSSLIARFFFESQGKLPHIIPVALGQSTLQTISNYYHGPVLLARESSLAGTIEAIRVYCEQTAENH
ncbi:uroporphyrinogen-III synthase [Legionella rubrilucens]|nr:uroporphyrinogen-III synthase [Legionella rubrilucens]